MSRRGSSLTLVPEVKGLAEADASAAIAAAGLVVAATEQKTNATIPAGQAVKTEPAAGSEVQTGSAVTLTISKGPKQVSVPAIVGLLQPDAKAAIEAAELSVGTSSVVEDASPKNTVLAQDPPPDSDVAAGSAVELHASAPVRPSPSCPRSRASPRPTPSPPSRPPVSSWLPPSRRPTPPSPPARPSRPSPPRAARCRPARPSPSPSARVPSRSACPPSWASCSPTPRPPSRLPSSAWAPAASSRTPAPRTPSSPRTPPPDSVVAAGSAVDYTRQLRSALHPRARGQGPRRGRRQRRHRGRRPRRGCHRAEDQRHHPRRPGRQDRARRGQRGADRLGRHPHHQQGSQAGQRARHRGPPAARRQGRHRGCRAQRGHQQRRRGRQPQEHRPLPGSATRQRRWPRAAR